jgi:hypothetical protein
MQPKRKSEERRETARVSGRKEGGKSGHGVGMQRSVGWPGFGTMGQARRKAGDLSRGGMVRGVPRWRIRARVLRQNPGGSRVGGKIA